MHYLTTPAARSRYPRVFATLDRAGWREGSAEQAAVALLAPGSRPALPPHVPVIYLVGREELPRLRGKLWADFLVWPADPEEVLLRVQARARGPAGRPDERERQRLQQEAAGWLRRFAGREEEALALWLTDPETGLFSRPYLTVKLAEELRRTERYHSPVSLALIQVTPGTGGDAPLTALTLKEVAGILLRECRDVDSLGRHGPSSFALILPSTGPEGAVLLVQRLGERIFTHPYADNRPGRDFQVRAGVVTYPARSATTARALLSRAEAALARAASQRRPEICIWEA